MTRRFLICVLLLLLSACSAGRQSPPVSTASTTTAVALAENTPTVETMPEVPQAVPTKPAPTPAASDTSSGIGNPSPTPVVRGRSTVLDAIALRAAKLRELRIKSPVQGTYLARKQFQDRQIELLGKEYPPAELRAEERVLKAFGLIPQSTDLRKLYLELHTQQVAGFYDMETDEVYVLNTGKRLNAHGEITYAHEVVHALQDQHFDLQALIEPIEDKNDDAMLAFSALVEGDATVLQSIYLVSKPEIMSRVAKDIKKEQRGLRQVKNLPPLIVQTASFPYAAGQNFVMSLRQGGRWDGVNAAYNDPPTSTEQILHPEKYAAREEPATVRLPDLASTLGPGWKKLTENTFGELQTRVLLEGQGKARQALAAAAGWNGDRFALWVHGDQEVVAWQTVWDSETDAGEFAAAMREYDETRFNSLYMEQQGVLTLVDDGRVVLTKQEAQRVSYVLAPTREVATKVLNALIK